MITANNIDKIYKTLCEELHTNGEKVGNTHELRNVAFELTNIDNNIINIRNISKSYLCGELTWYMTARKDMEFISKFAGLWGRISDDGETSYSAYGDIVFKRHGFNQINKVIELLKKDKNSRRAVVNFNVPNVNVIETKDEICTIALDFLIRDNKLYCTGMMRSNDIWFGMPYDVAFFTEIQKYIAHRVDVECGSYTHFVNSLHVYDNYFDKMQSLNDTPKTRIKIDIEKLNDNKYKIEKVIDRSENPKEDILTLFRAYDIYTEENYED